MISQVSINQRSSKGTPVIKFNYITPNVPPRTYSIINFVKTSPQQATHNIRNTPFNQIPKNRQPTPQEKPKSRRKKIFDMTYTAKGTFFMPKDNDLQRQKAKSLGRLNSSIKKQRKAIFSKPKKRKNIFNDQGSKVFKQVPYFYHSNQSSNIKLKPPSSLTSYVDVDALRKDPSQNYQINISNRYHEDSFEGGDFIPDEPSHQNEQNLSSEVKVEISDDEITNRSETHGFLPVVVTQERFFDKETTSNAPKKHQKLSEVNLYSTTINGNFGHRTPPPKLTFLDSIKRLIEPHLQQNMLPYLLIILGIFMLLVQMSK